MRIWLATVGEPLPMDGENVRLLRTAQFAQWLSDHGHEVVFWTGTMNHAARSLRHDRTTVTQMAANYKIVQLQGRVYSRAVSFERIGNHRDVAAAFAVEAPSLAPPDIILSSFPTEELCRAVLDYAEPRSIPVILDIRDLWPDIFADVIPARLRFLAPLALWPMERACRAVCQRATGLAGPARSMIKWGLEKAGRAWSSSDFWFPFTYPPKMASSSGEAPVECFKAEDAMERTWFCFFGALSPRYNLDMVIDAFAALDRDGVKASVVICGSGDAAEALKERAKGAANVHFPGWINAEQIVGIMERSAGGIFPYNTPDYFNNLPNKVCEYLAGGLPIVSCTHGEVKALIEETGCGFWHEPTSQAMQAVVRSLLSDPDRLTTASDNAKRLFQQRFEREAVFGDTAAHLQRIIDERQSGKDHAAA